MEVDILKRPKLELCFLSLALLGFLSTLAGYFVLIHIPSRKGVYFFYFGGLFTVVGVIGAQITSFINPREYVEANKEWGLTEASFLLLTLLGLLLFILCLTK